MALGDNMGRTSPWLQAVVQAYSSPCLCLQFCISSQSTLLFPSHLSTTRLLIRVALTHLHSEANKEFLNMAKLCHNHTIQCCATIKNNRLGLQIPFKKDSIKGSHGSVRVEWFCFAIEEHISLCVQTASRQKNRQILKMQICIPVTSLEDYSRLI